MGNMTINETIKTIKIDNFIKIILVRINYKYFSYFITDYNNDYFYETDGSVNPRSNSISCPFTLTIDVPCSIHTSDIPYLEESIHNLHNELTQNKIPRVKTGQNYYSISNTFEVLENIDLNCECDNENYSTSNYFIDKNLAAKCAIKMQDYLIQLWKEERKK